MLHNSATPGFMDVKKRHIKQWHLVENKWSQVGYYGLIERSGKLDILVPFDRDDVVDPWEISNGAYGWNGFAKHLCWAGGIEDGESNDNRTEMQKVVMRNHLKFIIMLWPTIKLIGHNQVNKNKSCPGFDVPAYARTIGIPEDNIDTNIYYRRP
jgi:N-acetylmuramoyl-L-alanine amidase